MHIFLHYINIASVICPFMYIEYGQIWLAEENLLLPLSLCRCKLYFNQFNK